MSNFALSHASPQVHRHGADIAVGVTGSFGNPDPNNADSVPGEVWFAILPAAEGADGIWHLTIPSLPARSDYKLYVADAIADRLQKLLGCD